MRSLIWIIGFFLTISLVRPATAEDEENDWDSMIERLNATFTNNDELLLVLALTNDDSYAALHSVAEKNKYDGNFDKFLDRLKTDHPSLHAEIQPLYAKKRDAYRSLAASEQKILDQIFAVLVPNLFVYFRNQEGVPFTEEEARKWKKTFGALTAQQKDAIRSKFPLLTYYVRWSGKVVNEEAEETESLLSMQADEAVKNGLFDRVLAETKNSLEYQKLLDALKAKDKAVYEQVKPLAEKLRKAYESLPDEPKALLAQIFEWIAQNREAFKGDSFDNYLSDAQVKQIKKKYYALPKDQQKSLESKFPLTFRVLKETFELSIAKSFNRNR